MKISIKVFFVAICLFCSVVTKGDFLEVTFVDIVKRSSSIVLAKVTDSDEKISTFKIEKVLFGETSVEEVFLAHEGVSRFKEGSFLLALDQTDNLVDVGGTTEIYSSLIKIEKENLDLKFFNGTKGKIPLKEAWYKVIAPLAFNSFLKKIHLGDMFNIVRIKAKSQYVNYNLTVQDGFVNIINFYDLTKRSFKVNKENYVVNMGMEKIVDVQMTSIYDGDLFIGINYSGYGFFGGTFTSLEGRYFSMEGLTGERLELKELDSEQRERIEELLK